MTHLRAALVALQFLSQIPVHFKVPPSEREVGLSLLYYPLVGLLFGVVLVLLMVATAGLPHLISAVLILIGWVWLSGALHLDGLADSADAWLGGRGDPERTLAIMKDPTAGPIAVVVLLLVLLLKFALIYSVLEAELLLPLLLAPVIGRMSLPVLLLTTPYARTQGLGRWLVDYAPRRLVLGSLLILTGALSLVGGGWLMLSFATVAALLWVLRRLMILRIGGATGDTLGASLELSEATFLLLACSQIL